MLLGDCSSPWRRLELRPHGRAKSRRTVKITNEVDVAGKVISNDALCQDERKVVLLKKRPGKDNKNGTDNADGAGKFSFGNPGLDPGRYYVKAKRIAGQLRARVSRTSSGSPTQADLIVAGERRGL